jgi:hypothetical protein
MAQRRDQGDARAAEIGHYSLPPRSHNGHRSGRSRSTLLRVLRSGEARVRSFAGTLADVARIPGFRGGNQLVMGCHRLLLATAINALGTLAHLAKVGSICAMLHSTDGFVRALSYRAATRPAHRAFGSHCGAYPLLSASARRDGRLERGVDTRTGPQPTTEIAQQVTQTRVHAYRTAI